MLSPMFDAYIYIYISRVRFGETVEIISPVFNASQQINFDECLREAGTII